MAAAKQKPEEDPRVALDLAVKLRRGQVSLKDIPPELRPKVAAVPERDLLLHAITSTPSRRYGRLNRPPASRQR